MNYFTSKKKLIEANRAISRLLHQEKELKLSEQFCRYTDIKRYEAEIDELKEEIQKLKTELATRHIEVTINGRL